MVPLNELVYYVRDTTGRQNITLSDLSWERALGNSGFLPPCVCL